MRRPLALAAVLALLVVGGTLLAVRGVDPAPRAERVERADAVAADAAPIAEQPAPERERALAVDPPCITVVDADGRPHAAWTLDFVPADGSAPRTTSSGAGEECVGIPDALRAAPVVVTARVGPLSAELVVDAADAGPRIAIVVAPPPYLRVRVDGPRPDGDLRYDVAPLALVPPRSVHGAGFAVTPESEARFAIAHSVEYGVRVTSVRTGESVEARAPAVALGREAEVVVRFPAQAFELALAGRVERGALAPGLWARVDAGAPVAVEVKSDGTFELWHARGETVELHAPGPDLRRVYEPEVATHPFGTRDVVIARAKHVDPARVVLRVVDAEGGKLDEVHAVLFRRDGGRTQAQHLEFLKDVATASVPPSADVEYVVTARDRRDARGLVFASVAALPGAEVELAVRLERGFRREMRVLHCSERTPIAGAELWRGGALLAVADGDGRALVELDEWPGDLEARAPGFERGRWPPPWQAAARAWSILLCPLE